jgi:hypothetical protein
MVKIMYDRFHATSNKFFVLTYFVSFSFIVKKLSNNDNLFHNEWDYEIQELQCKARKLGAGFTNNLTDSTIM